MPFLFRRLVASLLLAGGVALPVAPVLGTVRTSNTVIVTADETVSEDLYAVGGRTIVEGVVEGDLVVLTGEVIVTGEVRGDVIGLVWGPARLGGVVEESVLLAALRVEAAGGIGGDLTALAGEADLAGSVGRDAILIGGSVDLTGPVGRDVRSQAWRLRLDGDVGGNVAVRADDLFLGDRARVRGDMTFRASDEVRVSQAAVVEGSLVRAQVLAPIWAQAVSRLVGWLSVLGFLVAGVALFWLFRRTSPRAVGLARERPWRCALVGLAVLVVPPLAVIPLFLSLVGLPVGVLLLVAWALGLFLGPIPAVAAAGERLLGGRGGMLGGFVVGVLLWRAGMWALSLVAALLYLAALLVGLGAFVLGAWQVRADAAGNR